MAVLNDNQAKRKIKREKEKLDAVKKKADIIEKKEVFGSSWKDSLSEERKQELATILGTADCPAVVNVVDVHDFFEPINLFRDKEGNINELDYQSYLDAKKAYGTSLEECDRIIYEEGEENSTQEMLASELANRTEGGKKKRTIPKLPEYLSQQYEKWIKYFGRIVPLYDKYVCTCCGRPLTMDNYYLTYGEMDYSRVEIDGKMHTHICINCCKKMYEYLYYEKAGKDGQTAMMWLCSYLNIYFDERSYLQAKKNMDDKIKENKIANIVDEYMNIMNKSASLKGKVFLESKDVGIAFGGVKGNRKDAQIINNGNAMDDTEDSDWTQSELKAKSLVIKMVGYDPYFYQPKENRRKLYKDLLNMIEDDEIDGLRINGAIQIVLSFLKIREIEELYRKRWEEQATVTELKALTDLKTKELDTITKFSRDNGFGEAYQKRKSSGQNGFAGIMAKMNEMKFEDALANKYDIETSTTIQAAADASFKAIFNQLNLSEAEIYKTCQDQLKRLIELQRENASLQEQLRLTKKEIATMKLEEQKRLHDLEENDDDRWGGY